MLYSTIDEVRTCTVKLQSKGKSFCCIIDCYPTVCSGSCVVFVVCVLGLIYPSGTISHLLSLGGYRMRSPANDATIIPRPPRPLMM